MSKTEREMIAELYDDEVCRLAKEHSDKMLEIIALDKPMSSVYKLEPNSIKPSGVEYSTDTKQVGGNHYSKKAIQPWDYIVSNNMGYLAGNIIKYVSRYKDKNGIEDLHKAMHYLEKLIEVENNDNE